MFWQEQLQNAFALVVGIESYSPFDELDQLAGPLRDAQNVCDWLIKNGMPPDHICMLLDAQATRENIMNAFRTFLIDNAAIKKDAFILFYFSGHGSLLLPPQGWVLDGDRKFVECILPYDSLIPEEFVVTSPSGEIVVNVPEDLTARKINFAIPDRTLGGLLRQLQSSKGNNVLVVLDCCHSGHGTRGIGGANEHKYTPRFVNPKRLLPLPANLDEATLSMAKEDDSNPERLRGAVFTRQNDSHVLFAAARDSEIAWGNVLGGLFTRALLATLADIREDDVPDYDALHQRVCERYRLLFRQALEACRKFNVPADDTPEEQHPQCEGTHRSRPLFSIDGELKKWYTVQPYAPADDGRPRCQIHVGSKAGVRAGRTIFELYKKLDSGQQEIIARAMVEEVQPSWCLAVMQPAVPIWTTGISAFVVAPPLQVAFRVVEPNSPVAQEASQQLRERLLENEPGKPQPYQEVPFEQADVLLAVDARGIHVNPLDPVVSGLQLPAPFVVHTDAALVFPAAFPAIAHFNHCLALTPSDPSELAIDIRLHTLPTEDDDDDDDYLPLGPEIPFDADGTVTVADAPAVHHAIALHNQSAHDLFPYVFSLEPSTYEVQQYFAPKNSAEPPLRRGQTLQLGRSAEHYGSMYFTVPEDKARDASIIKVIVATRALDLAAMPQAPALGYDEDGDLHLIASGKARDERSVGLLAGTWAAFTRKIIVTPA